MSEADHGKGIDDYYRRCRERYEAENAKLMQMIKDGAPAKDISRQREITNNAGDTGD